MSKQSDTDLQKHYVRCRDLDGELWTVPAGTGSKLHLLLWSDQQLNPGLEYYIPVELLRSPWQGLDHPVALRTGVETFKRTRAFMDSLQRQRAAERLYRIGQFVRLQHRTAERMSNAK